MAAGAPLFPADPRLVDLSYAFNAQTQDDAPLVWHFAGEDKHRRTENGTSIFDMFLSYLWGGKGAEKGKAAAGTTPLEGGGKN